MTATAKSPASSADEIVIEPTAAEQEEMGVRPVYDDYISTDWRAKAERLIATACRQSQLQANTRPDGTPYRKHRPYSVPAVARQLIDCLNTDDEHRAKALFVFDYDVEQLMRQSSSDTGANR